MQTVIINTHKYKIQPSAIQDHFRIERYYLEKRFNIFGFVFARIIGYSK